MIEQLYAYSLLTNEDLKIKEEKNEKVPMKLFYVNYLQLIEALFENAPQLVLQLYIVFLPAVSTTETSEPGKRI